MTSLDSGLLAPGAVDFGDIPAAAFEIVEIHPQEHLGPVLGLGATGAGVNLNEAILRVVLAVQQGLKLDLVTPFLQIGQGSIGLVHRLGIAGFVSQVDTCARTSSMPRSISSTGSMVGLERFDFGDDGLGGFLVVPEAVFTHFVFKFFAAGSLVGKSKRVPDGDHPG